MSLLYGFYDSSEHDRVYNAEEFGSLFDGLITDGVYSTYKDHMLVRAAGTDMTVTVGAGRAWFNHTWTFIDAPFIVRLAAPSSYIDRVDAVVLRIDKRDNYRENSIVVIQGPASSTHEKPVVDRNPEDFVYQYPLAYITIDHEKRVVTQDEVENVIGTNECPFVRCVTEYITVDELLAQWTAQMDAMLVEKEKEFNDWWEEVMYDLDEDTAERLEHRIKNLEDTTVGFELDSEGYIGYDLDKLERRRELYG